MASAFFTTIYVVTVKRNNGSGSRCWYWDRGEAETMYESSVDEIGEEATVSLYSTDVQQTINDYLDEAVEAAGSSNSTLQELRSNRKAAEAYDVTWGELRFDPDGSFYVERLKASTAEYWPYIIEPYNGGLARGSQAWRVLDGTTATPIAIIRPHTAGTNSVFKVTVNGYAQTQVFNDLKSAAIYAATEYNGV